jgi:hypothetical protein
VGPSLETHIRPHQRYKSTPTSRPTSGTNSAIGPPRPRDQHQARTALGVGGTSVASGIGVGIHPHLLRADQVPEDGAEPTSVHVQGYSPGRVVVRQRRLLGGCVVAPEHRERARQRIAAGVEEPYEEEG